MQQTVQSRNEAAALGRPTRLAFVVSHPIQYYVPLYHLLAKRAEFDIKVFCTWHAAEAAVLDPGFKRTVAWDIPLTEGYEFELVPNWSFDAGTHRFFGLINPSLTKRVLAWRPDVVHITGWAWFSHLLALRALCLRGVPTLFRGDSHLLDARLQGAAWQAKEAVLRRVYSWPRGFLVVGTANRAYYKAFGVPDDRLYPCRHSIDVARFAEPGNDHEQAAVLWRAELGLREDHRVLLFAGKFEPKKRPLELMGVVRDHDDERIVLVMVGGGQFQPEISALARQHPHRFRVLPFQNQSRMPIVYRLADLFVLPSAYGETWGLAVNEAMACGRPVLVSDRVGCAPDVVDRSCGWIFPWQDTKQLARIIREAAGDKGRLKRMGRAAAERAWRFDVQETAAEMIRALDHMAIG